MPKLTFWFEFASPYSYLAAMRIGALSQAAGVGIIWRPFLLGPVFGAQGWETSPFNIYEAKGRYMWRDIERQAIKFGLPPVTRPQPFPQNGLLAARMATLGAGEPWGPGFVRAVYSAQFAEGLLISDDRVVVGILQRLSADGEGLVARAKTDSQVKGALRQATEQAQALGLFGAPSFVTGTNELFWGNDRLEDALAWAKEAPL